MEITTEKDQIWWTQQPVWRLYYTKSSIEEKKRLHLNGSLPCNGSIADRKFGASTASRLRWVDSCMHSILDVRFSCHNSGQSARRSAAVQAKCYPKYSTIGCRQSVLLSQCAVTHRRTRARDQTTQLTFYLIQRTHSVPIKISTSKAPLATVPFLFLET